MRFRAFLQLALIILFLAGWASGPVEAAPKVQDQGSSANGQAEKDAPSDDESPAVLSDAERLLRVERIIQLDKERLSKLRSDKQEREDLFDELAAELEIVKTSQAEKTSQFEELKAAGDLDEASSLVAEVAKLEQQYQLLLNQTDLTYKSAKSLGDQIRSCRRRSKKTRRPVTS